MGGKYRSIYEDVKTKIRKGVFVDGDKLPSEAEFMEAYSVSRQTVRSMLALLKEDGLIESFQGRGAYIKKKTVQHHTGRIALIMFRTNTSAFPIIIETIEQVLSEKGFTMMLSVSNQSVQKEKIILERLLQDPVDGVLFYPVESQYSCLHSALIQELENRGTRFLLVERGYADPDLSFIPVVAIDNFGDSYSVTARLIKEGHTGIGCVGLLTEQILQRYCGMRQALYDNDLSVSCAFDMTGKSNIDGGPDGVMGTFSEEVADRMIRDGVLECTALLCLNDVLAPALTDFLQRKGCGKIQTLVIYGNCEVPRIPGISYIRLRHNTEQIAKLAAEKIISRIGGKEEASEIIPFTVTE